MDNLTLRQMTAKHGIPSKQLKFIKDHFPEGFSNDNKVIVDKVLKFYEDNKSLITKGTEEKNSDALKKARTENVEKQNVLLDIQIEEAKKQSVLLKDVENLWADFAVNLSALHKTMLVNELPPLVAGLAEKDVRKHCLEYYNKIHELLTTHFDEWKKNNDEGTKK